MKRTTFLTKLFFIFCFILLFSCSDNSIIDEINDERIDNELDIEVVKLSASKLKAAGNENVTEDEYALKFKDGETFQKTMDKLQEMSTEERLAWNEKLNNFTSVAQEYEIAMQEAESYYDRPGGYEEFKAKYNNLYFPEEGDDYGAYIPLKNELEAFSTNENGRLIIGDEIINAETINSYDELLTSGRGMIEEAPSGIFDVDDKESIIPSETGLKVAPDEQDRVYAVYMTPGAWFFEKRVMGDGQYKHSTGWRTYGSRKIKIDLKRETKTNHWLVVLPGGFRLEWHLEVSFRKKGFLGIWYNYSSSTSTTVKIDYFDSSGCSMNHSQIMRLSESGTSSHDMWSEAYVIRYIKPDSYDSWNNVYDYYSRNYRPFPRCVYEMPFYWADITVNYQGVPQTLRFAFAAPTLYGYTNYSSDKLGWSGPL